MRIALLEDEPDQAELISGWLSAARHGCERFELGREFLRAVPGKTFDLAILDWGLPDMEGIEVLRALRARPGWSLPVLFVTARDREQDIVEALEAGADDYMSKPIRQAELLARLKALQRRAGGAEPADMERLSFPPFEIDVRQQKIYRDGASPQLTQREFELALFLFLNTDRLLSRGYILETVWSTSPDLNTRTVDTHVSRLRTKLKLTADSGWRLRSIYHHGYRLERLIADDADDAAARAN